MQRTAKTLAELSNLLPNFETKKDGISPRNASEWKRKFNWKPGKNGYNVARCRKDVMEATKSQMDKSGDRDEKTRLECCRLRVLIDIEEVELSKAELDLKKARGELLEKADVIASLAKTGTELRGVIESFRRRETARRRNATDKKFIDEMCAGIYELIDRWADKYK